MPVHYFQLREIDNVSAQSFTRKISIPGLKRVVAIRGTNASSGAAVSSSKITYSVNPETQEVTISLSSLTPTRSYSQSVQYPLTSDSVSGSTRYCRYSNGTTRQTSADDYCVNFINGTKYTYEYHYDFEVEYLVNQSPTLTVLTGNAQTLREGATYTLQATVTEPDVLDEVTVRYQIGNGLYGEFPKFNSQSTPVALSRAFTYSQGVLRDTVSGLTMPVASDVPYTVKVWAADDYGGTSTEVTRTFTAIKNLPPSLTLNPFTTQTDLVGTETIRISGNTTDPDTGDVTVAYSIGTEPFADIQTGPPGAFAVDIPMTRLKDGANQIRVRVMDAYGESASKQFTLTKDRVAAPLLQSELVYQLNAPTKTPRAVTLNVTREVGDLAIAAFVSMMPAGSDEVFVPMTKTETIPAGAGAEEDKFTYTAAAPMDVVLVKLIMTRQSAENQKKILRVSGLLN